MTRRALQHPRARLARAVAVLLVAATLAAGCTVSGTARSDSDSDSGSRSGGPAGSGGADPGSGTPLRGALAGLDGLRHTPAPAELARLLAAADDLLEHRPRASNPLSARTTDDPFVEDAQAAWTLALAHHLTAEAPYRDGAVAIVDDWVTTARRTERTCPDSGACSTSLMVSRAAPALVFAVDVLRADGAYDEPAVARFHRWLTDVILPAASDRDNNWGDAGTYLRAVVAAELGDRGELEAAADRWRRRIDLIGPDGQIPEEIRRDEASLMYSQEALDYKVATADVLGRAGIDVWATEGERGGSLEGALALVARGLEDTAAWPAGREGLRLPSPAGAWLIVAARWDDPVYRRLAARALEADGAGHSAVLWTGITHPIAR